MKKIIKVLQLGSPSGLYGAERWILALIKHLDSTKIESWVGVVSDEEYAEVALCIEARKLNFKTLIIESFGNFNLSGVWKLRSAIANHGIDIIHTHGYKTDLIGRIATIGLDCKIVSTPHGWTEKPDPKLWLYEKIDRLIFLFFDAVAPLSIGLFEPLSKVPILNKKLHLIINGVDISEVEQIKDTATELQALKDKGILIIGYIGRLTHGKGLDVLLQSVAEFGEPNWHIAFVGEGEQEFELKAIATKLGIEARVKFYGFRSDRVKFLNTFDVFALPSRSEGIPRCLMEAMSAGTPIVASDIPGCRNLIDGVSTGLLFEVDNPLSLANAIKRYFQDNNLKLRITAEAKIFISKNFSASRMAKEYEILFANMLE